MRILLQIWAFLIHQRFYHWGGDRPPPLPPGYATGLRPCCSSVCTLLFFLVVNNQRIVKSVHEKGFHLDTINQCFFTINILVNCFIDFNYLIFTSSRVLIATDLWARGLDVSQVSLVINYDLPNNRELYIHR